jgi:predicted dehydrogenase
MRFGLAGTGPWARAVQGPGLAQEPTVEMAAVWSRSPDRAAALAAELGTTSYDDYSQFLAQVDAVAFAVPPQVQPALAVQAAKAGKHLLLEKPIALTEKDADLLVAVVERAGVSTVVNFSWRFDEDHRKWLDRARTQTPAGAWARVLAPGLAPGSPYAGSRWREEKGALWDVTPHVLASLIPALGKVAHVTAKAGPKDLVHMILRHESTATSTITVTLHATPAADDFDFSFWGADGLSPMPGDPRVTNSHAFQLAVRELAANASTGYLHHPCDVQFGAEIVQVIARVERILASPSASDP